MFKSFKARLSVATVLASLALAGTSQAAIVTGDSTMDAVLLSLVAAVAGIALLGGSGSAIKAAIVIFNKAIGYFKKGV